MVVTILLPFAKGVTKATTRDYTSPFVVKALLKAFLIFRALNIVGILLTRIIEQSNRLVVFF